MALTTALIEAFGAYFQDQARQQGIDLEDLSLAEYTQRLVQGCKPWVPGSSSAIGKPKTRPFTSKGWCATRRDVPKSDGPCAARPVERPGSPRCSAR